MRFFYIWNDSTKLNNTNACWGIINSAPPLGKRASNRITKNEIPGMFAPSTIFVHVPRDNSKHFGTLSDIGVGGLSMIIPILLEEKLVIQVGFFLGTAKITSEASVKYILDKNGPYTAGIQFLNLESESAGYINGLYASLIMLH